MIPSVPSVPGHRLHEGWNLKPLRLCVAPKEIWNPARQPRERIRYVELSNIDSQRGLIIGWSEIPSHEAPSRAKKIIRAGNVLFATTRPNLKNIAVVPRELENEICSTGFCVLRPRPDVIETGWLFAACRSDIVLNQILKHDEKNAYPSVSDDEVLDALIPVPPLDEQRRIVARIEALTSRSQELRAINNGVIGDFSRMLDLEYGRLAKRAPLLPLGEVVQLARRAVDPHGMEEFPEVGIRSFGKGTFHKPALSRAQLGNKRVFRVQNGDLVFMNVFAWEGAIAVAKPEDDGRVASHRFMTHEVDSKKATPEFLCHHFLTEHGLEQIRGASPGSAGRNRTLGITKLHALKVPVPPVLEQKRFSQMVTKLNELRRLQSETEAELDAFTPALLAKAFRGEL